MVTNLSDNDLGLCLDYAHLMGVSKEEAINTLVRNGLPHILNCIFEHAMSDSGQDDDKVFATLAKEHKMLRAEPRRIRVTSSYFTEVEEDDTLDESDEHDEHVENPDVHGTEEIKRRWRKK